MTRNEHEFVLSAVLQRLGRRDDCRIWRATQGMIKRVDENGETHQYRAGKAGTGDLVGILSLVSIYSPRRIGVHLEIEIKTGSGRQSKAQSMHGEMVRSRGGIYFVAHTADEAESELETEKARIYDWIDQEGRTGQ